MDAMLDEAQEFLTGSRPPARSRRVLATVLFTDIVASTDRLSEMGDTAWTAPPGRGGASRRAHGRRSSPGRPRALGGGIGRGPRHADDPRSRGGLGSRLRE